MLEAQQIPTISIHFRSILRNTALDTRAGVSQFGLASSILVKDSGERYDLGRKLVSIGCWSILLVRTCCPISLMLSSSVYLGAMELHIIKPGFKYAPGQWLFIQIPEISRFQWHPVRPGIIIHVILVDCWSPISPSRSPVHYHISARRPLRIHSHTSSWRLHLCPGRSPRLWPFSCCWNDRSCYEGRWSQRW